MAVYYPKPLARLVGEFEKLPGIGPKSAQRLAFHIMRLPEEETRALAEALTTIKTSIGSAKSVTTIPKGRSATSVPTRAATMLVSVWSLNRVT